MWIYQKKITVFIFSTEITILNSFDISWSWNRDLCKPFESANNNSFCFLNRNNLTKLHWFYLKCPSSETANSTSSANANSLHVSCNPEVDCHIHMGSPIIPSLSQINPILFPVNLPVKILKASMCSCHHGMICFLGLGIGEYASRYGGKLRIYWISSCGQPTQSGPLAWGDWNEAKSLIL